MLGGSFMGKAHSLAYRDAMVIAPERVPKPHLVALCGRNVDRSEEARQRYGWERATTDWRELVSDPGICLLDNAGPNYLHVEPCLAAIKAGKHVYCEKPLAPTADLAYVMWSAAEVFRVRHMCAFNYRFIPALQLARQIIQAGELGEIFHYRANFLLPSAVSGTRMKGWRDVAAVSGAGALGDLGSHHIDLSRFLLAADPVRASGITRTVIPRADDGDLIETEDLFAAILQYENGTIGVLEASRVAGGHLVTSRVEVDGAKGSLRFSLQRLNELSWAGSDRAFRQIPVLRAGDPCQQHWFPPGHPIGWRDSFTHEAIHILGAIAGLHTVEPIGATFKDGYYCAEIVDSILRANQEQRTRDIVYRTLPD